MSTIRPPGASTRRASARARAGSSSSWNTLVGTALAVLTFGVVLAGCSSNNGNNHDMNSMSSAATSASASQPGNHNQADVTYCLHALNAASSLPSQAAAGRLVTVTLAGLRSPRGLP